MLRCWTFCTDQFRRAERIGGTKPSTGTGAAEAGSAATWKPGSFWRVLRGKQGNKPGNPQC
jgi:hypothetical protein